MKRLASYFDDDKAQALAEYLDVDINDVDTDYDSFDDGPSETVYIVDGKQYRVLDEDEAHTAFEHYIECLIEEIGFKNFIDYAHMPIEIAISDEENLRDWFYEDYYDYANEIEDEADEEYGNRLNQECIEYGLIDKDEIEDGEYVGDENLVELLADYLTNRLEDNFAEELMFSFDDDFVLKVIEDYCDIDYPAMVDWSLNLNDYGNWLSPIDGETMYLDNGYYGFLVRD